MLKVIFLMFIVTFSVQADDSDTKRILYNQNATGCTIPFFSKQKAPCNTQSSSVSQKIENKKKKISKSNNSTTTKKIIETQKVQLITILHKVKKYKQQTNAEKLKLQKELKEAKEKLKETKEKLKKVKKEFKVYKFTKKSELSKLHSKLKKLKYKKKKIVYLKDTYKKRNTKKPKNAKIVTTKVHLPKRDIIIHKTISLKKSTTPWIEVNIGKNTNIYDLALKYYGDSQEYKKIYIANKDKIDKNYQIKNDISLKIPITENFME